MKRHVPRRSSRQPNRSNRRAKGGEDLSLLIFKEVFKDRPVKKGHPPKPERRRNRTG